MDRPDSAVSNQLIDDVMTLLDADSELDDDASALVLGALLGDSDLASCLDGNAPSPPDVAPGGPEVVPARAYLGSITVEGFRGIGGRTELSLHPGPGVVLVVGRNGSGKSSFAEAAEVLLTGDNQRWAKRSAAWKDGWRNLHEPDPCAVNATLLIDGVVGETTVTRRWGSSADIAGSTTVVSSDSFPDRSIDALGWSNDLIAFRPFLSYNELGSTLEEGPSKLYDAISSVLGLEDLVDARERLRAARLSRDRAFKDVTAQLVMLRKKLRDLGGDTRANRCLEATLTKSWDLDAVDTEVTGTESSDDDAIALLDRSLTVPVPDLAAIAEAADDLRTASEALRDASGTDAERALRIGDLLEQALAVHEHREGTDCPVCGASGTFDDAWSEHATRELEELRSTAKAAHDARVAAETAFRTAIDFATTPPPFLEQLETAGLDASDAIVAWTRWSDVPESGDLIEIAVHLEEHSQPLAEAVESLRSAAREVRDRLNDEWRPVAEELATWASAARRATVGQAHVAGLKAAEKWLSGAVDVIRDERFQPIGDEVLAIWEKLRMQSNVNLEKVELTGSSTNRRVSLGVSVDGQPGVALGVMSQGELHAMALSLFLPRVMLPASPFGFVVIDDPVQAMDPARVDGLARVLEYVADRRQVIVFTHDDRLPEAMRRLRINARVMEVIRTAKSVVRVRETGDPATRNIEDARALVLTRDLPERPARRVIPVLCRQAVEAVAADVFRRRRLSRGDSHTGIEVQLDSAQRFLSRLALALFDDAEKAGDVMTRVNTYGHWAGDVVRACNRGAHEPYPGDLRDLVNNTEKLVATLTVIT